MFWEKCRGVGRVKHLTTTCEVVVMLRLGNPEATMEIAIMYDATS